MNSEIIVETVLSSENSEVKGKVEKKGGKRIGYNYIILKSLKEHPKNDVVKCIYIKSFTDFGICVIKEGTAGELKDKHGRDIKDRLMWQKELHQLLQDKVRIPRYIGSFEENGNYYLAIEHIKGKTLGQLCREYGKELREGLITGNRLGLRFLSHLLKVIDLLDTLHKYEIVHRDITSANFIITPGGKAALIDMELSYSIRKQMPAPPYMLGTYGYMSPEQLAVATPTIKEDVFSIGAILLQTWTGLTPAKLTQAALEDLQKKVQFLIPDKLVANITLQCLHPIPEKRPELKEVFQTLSQYRSDLKRKIKREVQSPPFISKEQIKETIQAVINSLATSLLVDKEKGWFAEDPSERFKRANDKFQKRWFVSYHIGCTGVLYFLTKAHALGFDIETTRPYINRTLLSIEEKYINHIDDASPGLHFGTDGIAVCLAEAMHYRSIESNDKYLNWINSLLDKHTEIKGITRGIAGQGMANLIISSIASSEVIDARIHNYASHLLAKQNEDGTWVRRLDKKSDKKVISRGFSQGMAGIIYFLLEYTQHYNSQKCMPGIEHGLQWLIKNAVSNKSALEWHSSQGEKVAPSWCDGGPGIALAFMKAYAITKNLQYKEVATLALNIHSEKIFANNLSLYNGLGGIGHIYLEAYTLLQDEQWLKRAEWIAQLTMHLKRNHTKYGPYWQVVNEKQPVAGFMQGNSGILHFLLRYCYIDRIGSPMTPDPDNNPLKALPERYTFSQTQLLFPER